MAAAEEATPVGQDASTAREKKHQISWDDEMLF
jgi:hypothetical protein